MNYKKLTLYAVILFYSCNTNQKEQQISTNRSDTVITSAIPETDSLYKKLEPSDISSAKEWSPVGSWSDSDPSDPGPSDYWLSFKHDGTCHISVSASWYDGEWTYNSAEDLLTLALQHFDDFGPGGNYRQTYDVNVVSEVQVALTKLSPGDDFPDFSGSYWLDTDP